MNGGVLVAEEDEESVCLAPSRFLLVNDYCHGSDINTHVRMRQIKRALSRNYFFQTDKRTRSVFGCSNLLTDQRLQMASGNLWGSRMLHMPLTSGD